MKNAFLSHFFFLSTRALNVVFLYLENKLWSNNYAKLKKHTKRSYKMHETIYIKYKLGMPGWLSGWAPAFGSGRDPRIRDQVLHWAPCEEPASPSAYISASPLNLCLSLINIKKIKKTRKLHDTFHYNSTFSILPCI